MSESKHTPGPYIAQKTDHEYIIVAPDMINSSQSGNPLACMDLRTYCHVDDKQMGIDAEFIVQACNSHDALLKACKALANGCNNALLFAATDKVRHVLGNDYALAFGCARVSLAKYAAIIAKCKKG